MMCTVRCKQLLLYLQEWYQVELTADQDRRDALQPSVHPINSTAPSGHPITSTAPSSHPGPPRWTQTPGPQPPASGPSSQVCDSLFLNIAAGSF